MSLSSTDVQLIEQVQDSMLDKGFAIIETGELPDIDLSDFPRKLHNCEAGRYFVGYPEGLHAEYKQYFAYINYLMNESFGLPPVYQVEYRLSDPDTCPECFKWHIDGGYLRTIASIKCDGTQVKDKRKIIQVQSNQTLILAGDLHEKPHCQHRSPLSGKDSIRKLLLGNWFHG